MPELPEVETTRRGIEPHIVGQTISAVAIREFRLRWSVPQDLPQQLEGGRFLLPRRRGKYLLLDVYKPEGTHTLMIHLGMSGSLRLMPAASPPLFHDHIDIHLESGQCLRYNDPRRFGSFHWLTGPNHPLLDHLGPEPLGPSFTGQYLYDKSRGRKTAIKSLLMDGRIVVGVGNIYANEALFTAGIKPTRAAGRVSLVRYQRVVQDIRTLLASAIEQGGTTLRDFVGGDGKPGYFAQSLQVYGRAGLPCRVCSIPLQEVRLSNRTTVFCAHCQR